MSNIEDKILNGPTVHYCEADDNDKRTSDSEEDLDRGDNGKCNNIESIFVKPDEETERLERLNNIRWQPTSTNTGPKGVIEDYKKRLQQGKKQSLEKQNNDLDDLEAEFEELLKDDSILKELIKSRIGSSNSTGKSFGLLYKLETGEQLLEAIDKEDPQVLVVVHLYTKYSRPCTELNFCLQEVAKKLVRTKFVSLDASVTSLSGNFKQNGVPALLAYKGGELVKSLVQVDEWLDKNFDIEQVEELLQENILIS